MQKSWLLVAALKKILLLPICLLHKKKEVNLSPGSVKERAETLSVANCARLESEALELKVDDNNLMLPLSIVPLQVLYPPLIFSILVRTLPFATSSWPYVHCRRILLGFKSSLH